MLVTLWEGLKKKREKSLSIAPLCPLCLRYYMELESLDMGRNRDRHSFTDKERKGLQEVQGCTPWGWVKGLTWLEHCTLSLFIGNRDSSML